MAVGSERFFWFWSPGLAAHLEVAAFYMIASATAFLLMRRYEVNSVWSMVLVCPLVAFVVEGVLTPIIYTGGPFVPFFPAWFTFWHGLMSVLFMLVVVRQWLLDGAVGRLALTGIGLGAFWAVWSSTLRLPENQEDEEMLADLGSPEVLEPRAFAIYVATFTAVFMVAHYFIGFVWPAAVDARRRSRGATFGEWLVGGLVAVGVAGWTVAVPWALPMFAGYAWIQVKGLRWHRQSVAGDPHARVGLLGQLSGRVRLVVLAPLALMAPVAAGGYAVLWELEPSAAALRVTMYSIIAVQAGAGFIATVAALIRARRAASHSTVPSMLASV